MNYTELTEPDRAVLPDTELASGIDDSSVNIVLAAKELAAEGNAPRGVGEVVVVILADKIGTDGFSNVLVRGIADGSVAFRPTVKITEGRACRGSAPGSLWNSRSSLLSGTRKTTAPSSRILCS